MSHYLKKILFAFLILMVPYINSTSQAMNPEDYQEDTVRYRQKSLKTEDSQDILSLTKQPTSLRSVDLEKPQSSWVPSISPSVKITILGCLFMAYQVLAVTAECYCTCLPNRNTNTQCISLGAYSQNISCTKDCAGYGRQGICSW